MITQIVSVFISFFLPEQHSHITFLFQGFDNVALTPGKATMVIHNFEVQTGHVVSMAELEGGYLKGWLHPKDYDLKQWVSYFHATHSGEATPEGPLRECSLVHLPQEGSWI